MAALTDQDKERCRYHLGYMETQMAASMSYGIARPVQAMFLVDDALRLVTDANAVERVRCLLDTLDGIEKQLRDAVKFLGAEQLGNLKMRSSKAGETHTDLLEREYVRWASRLADVLGAPLYPYSSRFRRGGPGMIPRGRG